MADELNTPTHRWYEPRNNTRLANTDFSKQWIYDSGVQKIDQAIATRLFSVPGSRGFFYDFSDYSTQFQDTAGTTPVTGVGQSVGLVLDESRGLARGPELATVTSVTGVAIGGPAFTNYIATPTLTVNTAYEISFTVSGYSGSGDVGVAASGSRFSPAVGTAVISGNGVVRFIGINVTASALSLYTRSTNTANFSNISVRELPGNHATQATAGNRPLTQVRPMGVTPRNLLTFSEAFDDAAWSKSAVGIAANSTVAPDGTSTADTCTPDTTTAAHLAFQTTTVAGSNVQSIYVKANGYTKVALREGQTGAYFAAFDLSGGGSVLFTSSATATITSVGNGWFRLAMVGTLTGTTRLALYVLDPTYTTGSVIGSWTPNGTSGVFLWGAQVENGSTASTYQPTGPALINGERRNLLTWTEQFDNAAWIKLNILAFGSGSTANSAVAPDGTNTADLIVPDTSSNQHGVYFSAAAVAGTRYTHSFYAKAAGYDWFYITEGNNVSASASFNLATGTVGTVAGTGSPVATITSVGNGWYRCTLSLTPISTVQNVQARAANANGGPTFAGNGTSGVLIWGAQLELGPTPTAYQRVVSTDEWYEPGFTSYRGIQFDGVDDFLQTAAIDFAGAESLGSELVTNGTFAVDANWDKGTGWTISGGVATKVAGTASNLGQVIPTLTAGRAYRVTFNVTVTAGELALLFTSGTTTFVAQNLATSQAVSVTIPANAGNSYVVFVANAAFAGTVDNISVREVLIPADKMTVVAGVRKLSDAGIGSLVELTIQPDNNFGAFALRTPAFTPNSYAFRSTGSVGVITAPGTGFPAPDTAVLTGQADISGDIVRLNRNGVNISTATNDQGTGVYLNAPVFIGRGFGGTANPVNGVLTFLCVINRTLTADDLADLEAIANGRTGAY